MFEEFRQVGTAGEGPVRVPPSRIWLLRTNQGVIGLHSFNSGAIHYPTIGRQTSYGLIPGLAFAKGNTARVEGNPLLD